MSSRRYSRFLIMLAVCTGCGTQQQSVTNAAGDEAARVETIWWVTLAILSAIFVMVVAWIAYAVRNRRGDSETMPEAELVDPARDRRMSRVIIVLVALVVVFEFGFLVMSESASSREDRFNGQSHVEIEVIGHRWWWEFRYPNPISSQIVTTANEIHIPAGVPILVKTASADVIHSFWAPNLQGKRDLIPGYQTAFWFRANNTGSYRGQCAEFCGHQHAHMAFYIVVEQPEQFAAWLDAQRKPAPEPTDADSQRGREVFMSSPCVTCHTIMGTDAASRVGPDLTHLASRSFIASATLPNTRGNLAGWITNAQQAKPGVQMPPIGLAPDDLNHLLAYLETLR
jgi:cytochrome c oxidase subunit II